MRWHTAHRRRAKRERWNQRITAALMVKLNEHLTELMERLGQIFLEASFAQRSFAIGVAIAAQSLREFQASSEFILPKLSFGPLQELQGRVVGFGEDGVTHVAIDFGAGEASIGLLAPPAEEVA